MTPTLQASEFSDEDGDTHASSHWQVDDNSDFTSPEWDSGEDYPATTEAAIPSGKIFGNTVYYWRVRYRDNRGTWSEWSTPWSFTAEGVSPAKNILTGGGKDTIRIVWDRSPEGGAISYNVYSASASGPFESKTKVNPEPLLDPVFVHGEISPLEKDSIWYYQIEAIRDATGEIFTSVSEEVSGQEGKYRIHLPEIRAPRGATIRYPISLLNARGITDKGFNLRIELPGGMFEGSELSFEKTGLTQDYENIIFTPEDVDGNPKINIGSNAAAATQIELNGEGPFIDLVLKVKASVSEVPDGATGLIKVTVAEFQDDIGTIFFPDISDVGEVRIGSNFRSGDVNGDGSVAFSDIREVQECSIGKSLDAVSVSQSAPSIPTEELIDVIRNAADINADGAVDVADVALARSRFAQKSLLGMDDLPQKGLTDELFEIRFKDAVFPQVPGEVEAILSLKRPPNDAEGLAGVAMTLIYDESLLLLDEVEMIPGLGFELRYDARDYLRTFQPGRLRMAMSRLGNSPISGDVARVRFKDRSPINVESTEVILKEAKMARASGEDLRWNNEVRLEGGRIYFVEPTPTDTPTPTETPTTDFNVVKDTANSINANDLLEWLRMMGEREKGPENLFDFADHWLEEATDGP